MDSMPATAEVRARVVAGYKGISVPTLWRHAKSGLLPAPRKRGGITYWIVGEVRAAFAAKS
ncbi:MAG: transcriptional regulator [Rubrivivax sp.]|nr:transcriptional regulator [Rubrivivax sp.]